MRKRTPKVRRLQPDPRFKDPMVTRFVNNLMLAGKKSVAYKIFYDAIDRVSNQTKEDGYEIWRNALNNVMPNIEVKSRRIGGATFQIPVEIRADRRISMGIKWLIGFAKKNRGKSMAEKLATEIISASKNEGAAIKKKEDTHRMAEANKAFSHFKI